MNRLCLLFIRCLPAIALATAGQLTLCSELHAAPPLALREAREQYDLSGHIEVLQDHTNDLTIQRLAAGERSADFVPQTLSLGKYFTPGSVWVRLTLRNETDQDQDLVLLNASRPYMEGAVRDLYLRKDGPGSSWSVVPANRSADGLRTLPHRHAVWRFGIGGGNTETMYLNIGMDGLATDVNLSLWAPWAFVQYDRNLQIVLGVYYGIMIVMVLYNLFLYLSLRDTVYLYYVLCIGGIVVFWSIENGAFQEHFGLGLTAYLYGAAPDGDFSFFLAYFVWVALTRFTQVYLRLPENHPRLNTVLWAVSGVGVVGWLFSTISSGLTSMLVLIFLNAFFYLLIPVIGVIVWKRGYRPAGYFLLGWGPGLVALSLSMTAAMDIVPGLVQYQYQFAAFTQLANTLEAILFSLGLADRINILRREREEQEALTREAERVSRETREQSERKSAFLASMAHELRTPLNAIKGFNNLVLRRAGNTLPEQQRDNLTKVDRASDHLLATINDLLDLSKIEAGRMDVNVSTFDVRETILAACEVVSPLVQDDVELRQDIADDIGQAHTDQQRLSQMLINLLSNAVKFTETGSVTISAIPSSPDQGSGRIEGPSHVSRLTSDAGARLLTISVSDTGKGIPESELPTLFDEYHQVDGQSESAVQRGTGLGLSITKRFAELLGGSINVRSEVGTGSTFTVSVPLTYQTESAGRSTE